jgi:flagellar basal body P-ring formation protein FlgA
MAEIPAIRSAALRLTFPACAAGLLAIALSQPVLAEEETSAWAAAPVPAVTLMPGDALAAGVLTERRFRQEWLARNPFMRDISALSGMVAVRLLPKGRPIPQSAVALRPAVVAGQAATVIFDGGTLQIATVMLAMDGGAEGDLVRMRNAETGAVINGRVTGHRRVTVGP